MLGMALELSKVLTVELFAEIVGGECTPGLKPKVFACILWT
jgi:hypothetical protein